jgi:hypothetical protein
MNPNDMIRPEECAMVGCGQPAAPIPLVVDVATMPGPFAIPLCTLCREPFEAGMEAVERLIDGDAEALAFASSPDREAVLEAQR